MKIGCHYIFGLIFFLSPIIALHTVHERYVYSHRLFSLPSAIVVQNSKALSRLPIVYEPEKIANYFTSRPIDLAGRAVFVAKEVLSLTSLGVSSLLQQKFGSQTWDLDFQSASSNMTSSAKVEAAQQLRDSLTRLGPTFIKLGQALSSRGDLVGLDVIKELQYLQDTIPHTFTTEEARTIILEDLGSTAGMDEYAVSAAVCRPLPWDSSLVQQSEAGTIKKRKKTEKEEMLRELLSTLSELPVASASLGQVYRARVGGRDVAVKVQRPRLREDIAADFLIARWGASILGKSGLLRADGVGAVDEYASRLFEELDYRNEAKNLQRFAALYAENGTAAAVLPPPGVVVPTLLPELCSERVLTMTWLDGEKLIGKDATVSAADLPLVQLGIECTLSQLLETGVLHADPHGGNLLKGPDGKLAYLDFGLVATIPEGVREALVCSVIHLVERNFSALAREFDSLMLMPSGDLQIDLPELEIAIEDVVSRLFYFPNDTTTIAADTHTGSRGDGVGVVISSSSSPPSVTTVVASGKRKSIVSSSLRLSTITRVLSRVKRGAAEFTRDPLFFLFAAAFILSQKYLWPILSRSEAADPDHHPSNANDNSLTPLPKLQFGDIIGALLGVAGRFHFVVPPYFLNNVRAIGTLEGMALTANFSLLKVVYPYVLRRVLLSDVNAGDLTNDGSTPSSDSDNHDDSGGNNLSGAADVEAEDNDSRDNDRGGSRSSSGSSSSSSSSGSSGSMARARQVFRHMVLQADTETGLLLPRWKRLRRLFADAASFSAAASIAKLRTEESESASKTNIPSEDDSITVGAAVELADQSHSQYQESREYQSQLPSIQLAWLFVRSPGGTNLIREISSNMLKVFIFRLRKRVLLQLQNTKKRATWMWDRVTSTKPNPVTTTA